MEWQPIETAPKDGTMLLLYMPRIDRNPDKDGLINRGCWYPESIVFKQPAHWHYDLSWCNSMTYDEPSHFILLPKPPTTQSDNQS